MNPCAWTIPFPPQKFTFIYVILFEKPGLRLPFNTFEKEILTTLNVSPTQLHANMFLCFFELKKSFPSICGFLLTGLVVEVSWPFLTPSVKVSMESS